MRQLYTQSLEEYLNGDDSVLPKGFILSNDIKYVNINFDMNYIKQTVEIKNIKNNNHLIKDKKLYPKTSQSRRDPKLNNTDNNHQIEGKDSQKLNTRNKIIRKEIKSKSINKQKIKNNLENDLIKNKNKYNLKEFAEGNKGSTKNIKSEYGLNKVESHKKESLNNFISKNKNNVKTNSKSVGKVYLKNKTNNFLNGRNNNVKSKNESNFQKTADIKERKNINIRQEKEKKEKRTVGKNNAKEKKLNNFTNNQQQTKIQSNQEKINNNNKNSFLPKEDLNLLNTFNYKELESKENTLLINQSNYNNASIPEMVDLDNNNTYFRNIENDININSNIYDIIMIDKNKNNENSIINKEQRDSLITEKILSDINGRENKNERPYTPPLQKIIPVNNENAPTLNNVNNITKINESLIQNHYNDLVYDKETGRYYDKKTKIFYDLNI